MAKSADLLLGEFARSLDERFRLSLPAGWAEVLAPDGAECLVAKEQPGCLSLWNRQEWQAWLDEGVELLQTKIRGGRLRGRVPEVQMFGRLLSTRHRTAPIAGRGRLAVPETFRGFLGVEPGGELLLVGAAVCVEIWQPEAWRRHIGEHMPRFRDLFNQLTE